MWLLLGRPKSESSSVADNPYGAKKMPKRRQMPKRKNRTDYKSRRDSQGQYSSIGASVKTRRYVRAQRRKSVNVHQRKRSSNIYNESGGLKGSSSRKTRQSRSVTAAKRRRRK